MEWVFYDKLHKVGTAPGSVRAEVLAEKRLHVLRDCRARREQDARAQENRLLRYSRSAALFAFS